MDIVKKVLEQIQKVKLVIPFITIFAIFVYLIEKVLLETNYSETILGVIVVLGLIPLTADIVISIIEKRFGVDLLALTSIAGSLLLGEFLAGAIIVLMLSGGEFLENFALKRSKKELTKLLQNSPKVAHLKLEEDIKDVNVEDIKVNDILIVKKGEIVPVDGIITSGSSEFDESAITGESVPVEKKESMQVFSGSVNILDVVEIRTLKSSSQSKYQQIVELVREAEKSRAPFVRMADRYSVWFTVLSFSLAILAYIVSGDPIRALSVLVVATPCPLILATPIAFAAGINKGASKGIVFKNGGIIEQLAKAKTFIFDKTGTLTMGVPEVDKVIIFGNKVDEKEILFIAGSIDQFSGHVIAQAIVKESLSKNIKLEMPADFEETFGQGVSASVQNKKYFVGNLKLIESNKIKISQKVSEYFQESKDNGKTPIIISTDKLVIGMIELSDIPRKNIPEMFSLLKKGGLSNLFMLTGDKKEVAESFAKEFGIENYRAECLPEDKVSEVQSIKRKSSDPVIMVGDGVNDAPALAIADVGIAMGVAGSTATTETSDIVISVPDITKVQESFEISKRVIYIAKQSIWVGIGLSTVLMVLAVFGFIPPVGGALSQEVIDVIVILNALRVLK